MNVDASESNPPVTGTIFRVNSSWCKFIQVVMCMILKEHANKEEKSCFAMMTNAGTNKNAIPVGNVFPFSAPNVLKKVAVQFLFALR